LPGVAESTGDGEVQAEGGGGTQEYRQHRFRRPPGATDIILVRHGESAPARLDRPEPRVDGRSDPPLDPQGRKEADRVADRLQDVGVEAIYVTSLRRTVETAAPLAARLGMDPVVEADLTEVYLGEWEGGLFRKHFAENHPIAQQARTESRWDAIPGAESNEAFQGRVRAGIGRIAAAHPDQRVVAVTHGGVIGTIVGLATGARPFAFAACDNGSINHLVVVGDHWVIRRFNDTGHLDTDLDRPVQPLI
jgi:probable phosphoglycerate mutase